MAEIPFLALWITFNVAAGYLTYRAIRRLYAPDEPEVVSADGTRSTERTPADRTTQDESVARAGGDPNDIIEADVEGITCPHCDWPQETGFRFCEQCIKPLYR